MSLGSKTEQIQSILIHLKCWLMFRDTDISYLQIQPWRSICTHQCVTGFPEVSRMLPNQGIRPVGSNLGMIFTTTIPLGPRLWIDEG